MPRIYDDAEQTNSHIVRKQVGIRCAHEAKPGMRMSCQVWVQVAGDRREIRPLETNPYIILGREVCIL